MQKIIFITGLLVSMSALASVKHSIRFSQARELLGKNYKRSVVSKYETQLNVDQNILKTVRSRLPKNFKSSSSSVALAIITESAKHSLDPYFVMAVISGESSFNPKAVGPVGEVGLMQLREGTGEWMAKKIHMKWKGEKTLKDPVANIKLGTAYLAWLRERFKGHGQLYVAAYNMGAISVKRAVGRNVWPKDYPRHVMKRYLAFYKEMGPVKL
jgi:soluble lytic murein transglycosylase